MSQPNYRIKRMSGRCLTGAEGDGGKHYHAVEGRAAFAEALCKAKPRGYSIGWSQKLGGEVTCPACLHALPFDEPKPALLLVEGREPQPVLALRETTEKVQILATRKTHMKWDVLYEGDTALMRKEQVRYA